MVSRSVNQAQAKFEGNNFDIWKHLLDFDDVLNKQRTAFYLRRAKYIEAGEKNEIIGHVSEIISSYATNLKHIAEHSNGAEREEREKIFKEAKEKEGRKKEEEKTKADGR